MTENEITDETATDPRQKLIRDFGVRALFGTVALLGYIAITCACVLTDRADMVDTVTTWYMPLIMAIVGFYFGGTTARGMK